MFIYGILYVAPSTSVTVKLPAEPSGVPTIIDEWSLSLLYLLTLLYHQRPEKQPLFAKKLLM